MRRLPPTPLLALALCASLAAPLSARASERELVVMIDSAAFQAWPTLLEIARDFEESHPGVRVKVLDAAGAVGQQDKARFMLAGDLQLDVVRIDVTEFSAFLTEGALVDLQPYFEEDRAAGRWDPDEYFPIADGFRDARGHRYGLPSTFTPYVMYANLDLLEACGIGRPGADWSWEDLLEACRTATADTDGDGRTDRWGISLTQWLQAVVPWIWQTGGELLDEERTRSRLDSPEAIEALDFLRRLLHEEKVASFDATFENQLTQGLFQAGRCAFYGPVGYWETYRFREIEAFRWDVLPLPGGRQRATSIAMTGYVVPRTARHPRLGYEFVRELAGPRYQECLAEIGNGVPGLISAARSESFLAPDRPPESERVFLDVLENARLMPPLANWRKIESICQAELQGVLLLEKYDAGQAARRMAGKIDDYLARERERAARPPLLAGAIEVSVTLALLAALAAFLLLRGPRPGALARRQERAGYGMIALWALGFGAFFLGPAVVSGVLALCEWSPLRSLESARWIGLDNFARLSTDDTFRTSLGATSLYALLSVPVGLVLALGLAMLLRAESHLSNAARTVVYLPAIISPVIVAAVWRFILDPDRGWINETLASLGLAGPAWIRSETWVVPSLAFMSLWAVGAQMLVFLAALQALDPTLDEAARVDGAGAFRRFWHVTVPSLTPVILFNLVIGIINAFQLFAQPYVMTQGGPGDASRFLVLYLYESGFRHLDMGYASAIAWVLFAILAVLCLTLMKTSRHWVHYAARSRQ